MASNQQGLFFGLRCLFACIVELCRRIMPKIFYWRVPRFVGASICLQFESRLVVIVTVAGFCKTRSLVAPTQHHHPTTNHSATNWPIQCSFCCVLFCIVLLCACSHSLPSPACLFLLIDGFSTMVQSLHHILLSPHSQYHTTPQQHILGITDVHRQTTATVGTLYQPVNSRRIPRQQQPAPSTHHCLHSQRQSNHHRNNTQAREICGKNNNNEM